MESLFNDTTETQSTPIPYFVSIIGEHMARCITRRSSRGRIH